MERPFFETYQNPVTVVGADVAPGQIDGMAPTVDDGSKLPIAMTVAEDAYERANREAREREQQQGAPAGPAITQVPPRKQQQQRGRHERNDGQIVYGGERWRQRVGAHLAAALGSLGVRPVIA